MRPARVVALLCGLMVGGTHSYGDIHYHAMTGNLSVVENLLANGADPNARDEYGLTPLHWAAFRGHTDVAKCLLDNGADTSAEDGHGRTPLDHAIARKRLEVQELLRAYGAGK